MALKLNDEFPPTKFNYIAYRPENSDVVACGIPGPFDTTKEFPNKKVVIVSVPGAFTPTCTANHIPPFIQRIEELKKKGVDKVLVLSANDPFVQAAWGKALGAKGNDIIFVSDGNAAFSTSIGQSLDLSNIGFGVRSARYAIIVDNNKVVYNEQEPGSDVTVSGIDAILEKL